MTNTLVYAVNLCISVFLIIKSTINSHFHTHQKFYCCLASYCIVHCIGGGSTRVRWAMALLNFKALHRNSIFAIENHLSLAKWPPSFQLLPPLMVHFIEFNRFATYCNIYKVLWVLIFLDYLSKTVGQTS